MRRYVVTGAPGAGKTTLLASLSSYGYPVVPEAATDVIGAQHARGVEEPWTEPSFLVDIVTLQRERERLAPAAPVVLFDRSPVCTLALGRYLGHPIPIELEREVARIVDDEVYDLDVFLVRPLGFIEPTAARRISYEDALAFETVHESTYRELGFRLVEVPPGTLDARARTVHDAIVTRQRPA